MLLQVYCRPTYEFFEMKFCDVHQSRFSKRNVTARLIITAVYNIIIIFLAALIPFFGDFVALVGAVGQHPAHAVLQCTCAMEAVLSGAYIAESDSLICLLTHWWLLLIFLWHTWSRLCWLVHHSHRPHKRPRHCMAGMMLLACEHSTRPASALLRVANLTLAEGL